MENPNSHREDNIYQLKLISLISMGMFLFVLFFHPFDYQLKSFNDQLIFVLGIAAISFIILLLFRIILPSSVTQRIRADSLKISNEVGNILLIWLFISAGNIFFLHYVGRLELSLFTGFRISLYSSFPSIILKLADVNRTLREQLRFMVERNLKLGKDLSVAEHEEKVQEVFYSDTKSDRIELYAEDVMLIKSADNYVELVYMDGESIKQKLLRNTMKNIQTQLSRHSTFVRCHRTCIVNSAYILNLTNSYKGHRLKILNYQEEIPVSRQYLHNMKSLINTI